MSRHLRAFLACCLAEIGACRGSDSTAPSAPSIPAAVQASPELVTCATCVVGPLQLERHAGRPEVHSWTFAARAGATYLLHLDELGTRGANAQVSLNGVALAWRTDSVGTRRHSIELPLVVAASNTLTITLTGRPGSRLGLAVEPPAPATATLTVAIGVIREPQTSGAHYGPANGRVTAPGIDCVLDADVAGGDCSESYPIGTVVTLTPMPGERSMLWESYFIRSDGIGAGGCPSGPSGQVCAVTVTADTTLVANFAPLPTRLEVTVVAAPGTSAWINGNEISCYVRDGVLDAPCRYSYWGGILDFSLRVMPMDAVFVGWSGFCTGTGLSCSLTSQPGDTVRVTATFAPLPQGGGP